jgi:hypothetical protein
MNEKGKGRGRKPRPWTPEEQRDIERAQSLPSESGPFGMKWMANVAGHVGRELCDLYNKQRYMLDDKGAGHPEGYKNWQNRFILFGHLFEGLSILTESYGVPEYDRNEATVMWVDPYYDAEGKAIPGPKESGSFTLWGTAMPKILLAAMGRPKDGSPLVLRPFGIPNLDELGLGEKKKQFDEEMKKFTVVGNDVDGTMKRIRGDAGVPSAAKKGKFVAGRGPERDPRGRRIVPVIYQGKREVAEMRAVVTIATFTTACFLKWLEWAGSTRTDANTIWFNVLYGLIHVKLIHAYDENKKREGAFGEAFTKDFGEEAAWEFQIHAAYAIDKINRLRRVAAEARYNREYTEFHPPSFRKQALLQLEFEFEAVALLGTYLQARFMGSCMYYPKGGTIRLCRREGCEAPAFVWLPPDKDYKHNPRKGKPNPPNYCPSCNRLELKEADKQKRYDRKRKRRRKKS